MIWSKLAKLDYLPLFVALHSETDCNIAILIFEKFICDDLVTLCVNLMNFQ